MPIKPRAPQRSPIVDSPGDHRGPCLGDHRCRAPLDPRPDLIVGSLGATGRGRHCGRLLCGLPKQRRLRSHLRSAQDLGWNRQGFEYLRHAGGRCGGNAAKIGISLAIRKGPIHAADSSVHRLVERDAPRHAKLSKTGRVQRPIHESLVVQAPSHSGQGPHPRRKALISAYKRGAKPGPGAQQQGGRSAKFAIATSHPAQ